MTREVTNLAPDMELFVWSLFLLGGETEAVDVEDVYLKCFEIAPRRFGWRTRPDLPDYKKTAKAMQSVEAKTDFVIRFHEYSRRLSPSGVRWVLAHQDDLGERYKPGAAPPARAHRWHNLSRDLKRHPAWQRFLASDHDPRAFFDVADALKCPPSSPKSVWVSRLADIDLAAEFLGDDQLSDFRQWAAEIYKRGVE